MPTVPLTVWEQATIIVIFSFLLAGATYIMVRSFSSAVADINKYYADVVEKSNIRYAQSLRDNNEQWQKYFDARSETSRMIETQTIAKLESLTEIIERLADDFSNHDQMERLALEMMNKKRNPILSKNRTQ